MIAKHQLMHCILNQVSRPDLWPGISPHHVDPNKASTCTEGIWLGSELHLGSTRGRLISRLDRDDRGRSSVSISSLHGLRIAHSCDSGPLKSLYTTSTWLIKCEYRALKRHLMWGITRPYIFPLAGCTQHVCVHSQSGQGLILMAGREHNWCNSIIAVAAVHTNAPRCRVSM